MEQEGAWRPGKGTSERSVLPSPRAKQNRLRTASARSRDRAKLEGQKAVGGCVSGRTDGAVVAGEGQREGRFVSSRMVVRKRLLRQNVRGGTAGEPERQGSPARICFFPRSHPSNHTRDTMHSRLPATTAHDPSAPTDTLRPHRKGAGMSGIVTWRYPPRFESSHTVAGAVITQVLRQQRRSRQ